MQDFRALDMLISLLKNDADKLVRIASIIALESYRDERAVAALIEALHDPDIEVCRHVVKALGIIEDSQCTPALLVALRDSDVRARRLAALALGKLGDTLAVDGLLLALADAEAGVRTQAASALGELDDSRAVFPLMRLLEDSDPLVIRSAALALGQLGDPMAAGSLTEVLILSDDTPTSGLWQAVRDSAIYALSLIGDARTVSFLLLLLEQPRQSSHTLCMLIDALGQIGDEQAREPLRALLEHRNPAVRKRAERVLAK